MFPNSSTLTMVATQHLSVLRLDTLPNAVQEVEHLLLATIPVLWQQAGLVDVNVLKRAHCPELVLLINWDDRRFAEAWAQSSEGARFAERLDELRAAGLLRTAEILNDTFELIE